MTRPAYEDQRRAMVLLQLRTRESRTRECCARCRTLPRHPFVPDVLRDLAYADRALPIGFGQTISQPLMVAMMLEASKLTGSDSVLEVGTGSEYQAALLGQLARHVTSVEIVPELAERATSTLASLGYNNVAAVTGNGSVGWPAGAPYEAIVVAAGAPDVPTELLAQLGESGRLVIPVGSGMQELIRVTKHGNQLHRERLGGCAFVPLRGKHGWR